MIDSLGLTITLLASGIFYLQGEFTSGQQAVCYSEEWLRNDFKFQFRGWWGSWRWYHSEIAHSEVQLHQNWWAWTICQCQEAYRYVPNLKFMLLGISSSLVPLLGSQRCPPACEIMQMWLGLFKAWHPWRSFGERQPTRRYPSVKLPLQTRGLSPLRCKPNP